jgi:hypothetical protein
MRVGLIIVHCFVAILIGVSMIEVFKTLIGIIGDLENHNELLLVGALATALVPSGAMLFWACKAVAAELYLPIERVRRYFWTQRKA